MALSAQLVDTGGVSEKVSPLLAKLREAFEIQKKRVGLTTAALGKRAGVSQGYISQIFSGKRGLSLSTMEALWKALELPPLEAVVETTGEATDIYHLLFDLAERGFVPELSAVAGQLEEVLAGGQAQFDRVVEKSEAEEGIALWLRGGSAYPVFRTVSAAEGRELAERWLHSETLPDGWDVDRTLEGDGLIAAMLNAGNEDWKNTWFHSGRYFPWTLETLPKFIHDALKNR
ncbi:MAG TPA: helix-turn-helix transcriptional regulator [Acidobacteriota bacterium]|nr:helix-turn-helix transcriptional regulator [Acidobacteriota bacterium]